MRWSYQTKRLAIGIIVLFICLIIPKVALNQPLTPQFQVQRVLSVGMTVANMEQALKFYTEVLPFKKIADVEVWGSPYEKLQGLFGIRMRVVRLALGQEIIELIDYLTPGGRPIPLDARSNDRFFQHIAIVVSDMEQAYQRLRAHHIQYVSPAPQRLPAYIQAAAGIEAFYFRDPDGHNLEIIHFPQGKGNPRWQQPTEQIFLGIDHTAIAVNQTSASLNFYQDLLGLKINGTSTNYGFEQEHLNNVAGAKLQITSLGAPAGPGIEFLEYLQPRDGKPFPPDRRPDDLLHWETTLVVDNLDKVAKIFSAEVVKLPETLLGFKKGFLLRDPDGHVLRVIQETEN